MTRRPWTSVEIDLLETLYQQGLCATKIAKHLLRSVQSVNRRLDRLGRNGVKEKTAGRRPRTKNLKLSQAAAKQVLSHRQALVFAEKRARQRWISLQRRERKAGCAKPYPMVDMAQMIFIAQDKYNVSIEPARHKALRSRCYYWVEKKRGTRALDDHKAPLTPAQVLVKFNKLRLDRQEIPFHVDGVTVF